MDDAVVDASVWVSRLVASERHHGASRTWLENARRTGALLIAPALLLPEVGGALARRTGAPALARRAMAGLLRLRELRLVALDRELAEQAGTLAAQLALRGADAVYVATALRLRLPLVTWDHEQRTRARAVVSVHEPTPR